MEIACKSVKETSLSEMIEWNAINPISEKPKFGRGTGDSELKRFAGRLGADK